jgi:hypothetical protein
MNGASSRFGRVAVLCAFLASSASLLTAADVPQAGKPNVIIIYTDDHGYADLSCQGIRKDIKTPHTDKLAAEGVRFTTFRWKPLRNTCGVFPGRCHVGAGWLLPCSRPSMTASG